MSDAPLIFAGMSRVMKRIGPVAKSMKNQQAGYSARSIDDVMDACHAALVEESITVLPITEKAEYDVVEVGKNRTPMRQATLQVRFRFYAPDGSSVDAVTCGEALDSGDKATSKAHTAAFKVALLQSFVIPLTGEKDDPDSLSPERSGVSKARRNDAKSRAMALQADGIDVAAARAEKHLPPIDKSTLEEIAEWESLLDALEGDLAKPFEAAS